MGNKTNNTIEINGKRYDAVSGELVGGSAHAAPKTAPAGLAGESRFVDGVRRSSSVRKTAVHAAPHKPVPSKTLMRTAVKKPDIKAPSRLKASGRADVLTRVPVQTLAPKLSHTAVDPKRLKKAHQMVKSPAVSRYASTNTVASPSYNHAASLHGGSQIHIGTPTDTASTIRVSTIDTKQPASSHIPVTPAKSHAKQPDIFEQALAHATSHEQRFDDRKLSAKSRRRSRLAGLTTAAMSLLLVAGILAYLNAPMLSVRLASSKAGFSARLPGYSPAGFTFGNLSYGPGNVTVSYNAEDNADKRFDITQRVSNWDSQSLLTNFVSSANKAYQTYERAGRTIYFYGNNTATWVDSGVWYTVNGNNSLTKNQLLDLAGSI